MEHARLDFADLARAREDRSCLVCGATAAAEGTPVLAAGVDLAALEDYLPAWPLCLGCAGLERAVLARARLARIAVGFLPAAAGLAIAIAIEHPSPLAPSAGVALGALASLFATLVLARSFTARLPLVVLEASGRHVGVLRRRTPVPAVDEAAGPYRSAAVSEPRPAARVPSVGGAWAWLLGVSITSVVAWFSTNAIYPRVRFDNGSDTDMLVEIDGGRLVAVRARDRVDDSLRYGPHRLRVRYADEVTAGEVVDIELPFASPHFFAVDGERCFTVSHSSESRVHRWARFTNVTTSTYTVRGRFIAVDAGAAITRSSCSAGDRLPF